MKTTLLRLSGALCLLIPTSAWGANHVLVESKSVALGAAGVTIGVYVENDVELNAIVIPLEFREITTSGGYMTNTLTVDAANRFTTSLIGFVTKNFYPDEDNTNPLLCGGSGYMFFSAVDFISPDAFMYSAVQVSDPCLPVGNDGVPPGGTPSLIITFDVTNVDGLFEIDSTCTTPGNHLVYSQCGPGTPVVPTFTRGLVTIGNPVFPPEVSDIPDQTIDEGSTFAQINLNDYVVDPDNTDAEMTWTATGQSQLGVVISPGKIATILIPNPDWFGSETITFRATDLDLQFDEDAATFTVNPVNDPPVWGPISNKFVEAGKTLAFAVGATDIDDDSLDITMEGAPAAATLADNGVGLALFNWLTTCADEGVHMATFIVSDGDLADTATITITVTPNPDTLVANPGSLDFVIEYGTDPAAKLVNVTDPGCGEIPWEVEVNQPWVLLSIDTGFTPGSFTVDIDTAGLYPNEYNAIITLRERTVEPDPIEITIPVHVSVESDVCLCPCQGDWDCDDIIDVFDVIHCVDVAFRNYPELGFSSCPFSVLDANCDCAIDVFDVVVLVDHAFRADYSPICGFDDPCEAPDCSPSH